MRPLREIELSAKQSEIVDRLVCPSEYGPPEARRDGDRLHQLRCKRLSSRSGTLDSADDQEEALLTARVASFWHRAEGKDLKRMYKLQLREISHSLTADEEQELDRLSAKY
jgi:hypothetical protein